MKNVKILIATHKQYFVPKDNIYLPIHVGADSNKNKTTFIDDNTGENISNKNPYFCELTGLYWAWKNLKGVDYVGLVHYRRYFTMSKKKYKTEEEKFKHVLTTEEADKLLENNNIILPKLRKYYIENLYDHYAHTMYVEPLNLTDEIIKKGYKNKNFFVISELFVFLIYGLSENILVSYYYNIIFLYLYAIDENELR